MGIRVFHCDDSEAFTRLVAFWLAEHPDIEHVGEAPTAEAALDLLPMLEELSPAVRGDDAFLRDALVRVTRQVFRDRVSRRPYILPLIVRV